MRRNLLHGLLAGLAGGAAFSVVLLVLGEGPIGDAVALEQHHAGEANDALFTRRAQQAGGVLAGLLYGLSLGAIFGLVFVPLRRRLHVSDDWRGALWQAGIGFLTLYVVPFLKYPANPPAVGDPDTIGERTVLWLLMLTWSVIATWAAWRTARALRARGLPEHVRFPAVAGIYLGIVITGLALLPASPDAVSAPATLIWRFRLASVAGAAAFWAVLGTVFGWLRLAAHRGETESRTPSPALSSSR